MYMFVGAKHTKHNHKPQSVLFLYYVYVWGCNTQQTQPQTARHFYFYIMYTVWGCNAHQTIHNIHYTPFINRYSLRISGTFLSICTIGNNFYPPRNTTTNRHPTYQPFNTFHPITPPAQPRPNGHQHQTIAHHITNFRFITPPTPLAHAKNTPNTPILVQKPQKSAIFFDFYTFSP